MVHHFLLLAYMYSSFFFRVLEPGFNPIVISTLLDKLFDLSSPYVQIVKLVATISAKCSNFIKMILIVSISLKSGRFNIDKALMTCPDINPEQINKFSDKNMLTFDKKEEKVNIILLSPLGLNKFFS